MLVEHSEDSANMAEVFSQGAIVDQDVVEEDEDEETQELA